MRNPYGKNKNKNKVHREKGGNSQPEPWRRGVRYQRFFSSGQASHFFEVEKQSIEQASSQVSSTVGSQISYIDIMARQRDAFKAEVTRIEVVDDKLEPNDWLNRTGWARYLAKFEKEDIKLSSSSRPSRKTRHICV